MLKTTQHLFDRLRAVVVKQPPSLGDASQGGGVGFRTAQAHVIGVGRGVQRRSVAALAIERGEQLSATVDRLLLSPGCGGVAGCGLLQSAEKSDEIPDLRLGRAGSPHGGRYRVEDLVAERAHPTVPRPGSGVECAQ